MKKAIKWAGIVVATIIIIICVVKLNEKPAGKESSKVDKGSYSYYYSQPTELPNIDEEEGIYFYSK